MATRRKSELDRFLESPALPPRAIGRSGGGWTNYDVVVAVCGARGVHAVDAALYDAVSLRYGRKVATFAQAFAACLVGRRSVARMDLATLQDCHPAFAALQLPESIDDRAMAAQIGEWFLTQANERNATMKTQPQRSAFKPRCTKNANNPAWCDCRACKVAVGIRDAFLALTVRERSAAYVATACNLEVSDADRERIADGIVGAFYALRAAGASHAPLTVVAKPTAAPEPADRALRHAAHVYHTAGAARHGEALDMLRAAALTFAAEATPAPSEFDAVERTIVDGPLAPLEPIASTFDAVEVARGLVEMAQAIRDAAHMAMLAQIEKRVADVERARKAPRQVAARVHRCDTCRKNVDTCYVFQGRVWCVECRKSVAKITARAERSAFAV